MKDQMVRGWENSHNEKRRLDTVKFGSSTEENCWHQHNRAPFMRSNTVTGTPIQRGRNGDRLVGYLGGTALRRE
jgi:hypothetical protein